METSRVAEAMRLEAAAQERLDASRAAFAHVAAETDEVETLLARDRQLRLIRQSGAALASRLATIGNLCPSPIRLVSLRVESAGYAIKGYTKTLPVLDRFVSNLLADRRVGAPDAIQLERDDRAYGTVTFSIGGGALQ